MANTKPENKDILILTATNDNYVPYLAVMLHSLVRHIRTDYCYRIYVLEEDVTEAHKDELIRMIRQFSQCNVEIEFRNVHDYYRKMSIPTVNHLSHETTYRLLAEKLFPQYDKMLYLDVDIVICRDVAELYHMELENAILGASKGILTTNLVKYICDEPDLGPEMVKDYFNAGILLMNLKKMRELKVGERGLKMLEQKQYLTQDQDVLNSLCHGAIKFLPKGWNVEWENIIGYFGSDECLDKYRDITPFMSNPYIVHYTTRIKPWAHPGLPLADYFWREARQTDFYEEILFNNLSRVDLFSHYVFPWGAVEPHSRIILYGYGNVGKKLYEQIRQTRYCEIVAVADKRAKELHRAGVPFILPEEIRQNEYDCILLAIEQEKIATGIRRDLIALGIPENHIVWESPVR